MLYYLGFPNCSNYYGTFTNEASVYYFIHTGNYSCRDVYTDLTECPSWASDGYCTHTNVAYVDFMETNCRESCNVCYSMPAIMSTTRLCTGTLQLKIWNLSY